MEIHVQNFIKAELYQYRKTSARHTTCIVERSLFPAKPVVSWVTYTDTSYAERQLRSDFRLWCMYLHHNLSFHLSKPCLRVVLSIEHTPEISYCDVLAALLLEGHINVYCTVCDSIVDVWLSASWRPPRCKVLPCLHIYLLGRCSCIWREIDVKKSLVRDVATCKVHKCMPWWRVGWVSR